MNIKQILIREWTGNNGQKNTDIIGLAEDNNLYQWNRFEGKWTLYLVKSTPSTNDPFNS